jgi:hypothetical protein
MVKCRVNGREEVQMIKHAMTKVDVPLLNIVSIDAPYKWGWTM